MPKPCDAGWTVVSQSALITSQPVYLVCVNLTVETNGDYVEVYDGRDDSSGRKVIKIKALANRSVNFNLTTPIYCESGLYLSFSATDSEVTVIWLPAE